MFGRRPDATPVRELSAMRRFMPYVSPRRNDSLFYMMQQIEVEAALEHLEKRNRERPPDRPITLFHLFLRSCGHALHLRPGVNRFVKAGRLWQRDGEWLTFSAKREIKDGSPMLTVKRRFHPTRESLDEMVDAIYDRLRAGRAGRKTTSDKEMGLLLRLPGPAIRLALWLARVGDRLGLLPRSMIEDDPLYASVFVANLGSVGLDAAYHHLYEYGTIPVFATIGRLHRAPVVLSDGTVGSREVFVMRYTYDERIEDGFYAARALEYLQALLEAPERLVGAG